MSGMPTSDATTLAPSVLRHAAQYAGMWAMEPRSKAALEAAVARIDLANHVRLRADTAGDDATSTPPMRLEAGGIAVLELRGTMTKYGSSLSDAPSSLALARTIRGLGQRADVRGIVMVIDSPGGLVAGTDDLQRAVLAARERGIATVAFCEDLCASAGYWLASGFEAIVGNPGLSVGSIGAFAAFTDVRAAYEAAGVRVDVIASAPLKGAGTQGTSLSEAQRAEWQREVNECADLFVDAIARGRGVSTATARAWADARMHNAEAAIGLGLIDEIGDFADAMALCREMAGRPAAPSAGDTTMRIAAAADHAATIDEATMTDAALRAWLAEHRPAVLAMDEQDTEDEPAAEDAPEDAPEAPAEDADAPAAEDAPAIPPDEDGDDEDEMPEDGAPAPETAAAPATIAELEAAGITDSAFLIGALKRGLTAGAAALAWDTVREAKATAPPAPPAPSAAQQREAHTNDPVGGGAGSVAIAIPGGDDAATTAAWTIAWDTNEPLRELARAAGFRDKRTLAQFAAPESAAGRDVIAYLRKAAASR